MYLLRFKRSQDPFLFLCEPENGFQWGLTTQLSEAKKVETKEELVEIVNRINAIEIPKKPFEWWTDVLFLFKLYGYGWDDQVEGLLVESHEQIKAQVLDEQMNVVETHRMHNPVWPDH